MKKHILNGKAITFALVLLMLVSLFAGCSSEKPDEGSSGSPAPGNPVSGTPTPSSSGSGESTDIVDSINVYTALEDDIINAYLVSFKAKYPKIEVKITRDATGTIISKLIAEKDNPIADVVWGTAVTSELAIEQFGLIEPYAPVGIERVLPQFKDKQSPPRWVGMEVPEGAMVVDAKKLGELGLPIPTGFDDLTNPIYKGLIQAPDPSISGTGLLILSGILQIKGEDAGWAYLDAFNANVSQYPPSGSKPAKNVDAGEAVIGLSMGYRCVTLARDNPDLQVVFFSEGCPWDVEANMLIKKASIKPAAKVFLDWAISDEAMAAYRVEYPIVATGGDGTIPEGYNQDPVKNLSDKIDLYSIADTRDAFISKFTEKYVATR